MEEKRCFRCKATKPQTLEYFYQRRDKWYPYCRVCVRSYRAEWRKEHGRGRKTTRMRRPPSPDGQSYCLGCRQHLELSCFWQMSYGPYRFCRTCSAERGKSPDPRPSRLPPRDGQAHCLFHNTFHPLEEFWKSVSKKYGIDSVCKKASTERRRAHLAAEAIADPVHRWTVEKCECGRRKRSDDACCPRCLMLDGEGGQQSAVIAVLRLLTRASTEVLADELDITVRHLLRIMPQVVQSGRVTSIYSDDDGSIKKYWVLNERPF